MTEEGELNLIDLMLLVPDGARLVSLLEVHSFRSFLRLVPLLENQGYEVKLPP